MIRNGFSSNRTSHGDPSYIGKPTDGRVVTHDNIYIGKIKDNQDALRMGRLKVWIRELCGPEEDSEDWILVSYATAFGGATPIINGAQTSYGMWSVPPDLDVEVAVFFVNGDPNRGYWFASIYPEAMNHSTIGASTTDGSRLVNEADRTIPGNSSNEDIPRPDDALQERVSAQGLDTDQTRGMSYSSPRRTGDDPERPLAPARVYGTGSPRGHHLVFDDGRISSVTGEQVGSLIRLRTAAGNQIIMDDTEGFIYFVTKDGNTWFEITEKGGGNIDMYSAGNVSIRGARDINLKADNNVKIEGGSGVYISSEGPVNLSADADLFLTSENETIMNSNGLNIKSNTYSIFETDGIMNFISHNSAHINAESDLNLISDRNINVDAGVNMNLTSQEFLNTSSGDQNMSAGGNVNFSTVNFDISATSTRLAGTLNVETKINTGAVDISGGLEVAGSINASGVIDGLSAVTVTPPEAPAGNVAQAADATVGGLIARKAEDVIDINRIPDAEPWPEHTSRDISVGDVDTRYRDGYSPLNASAVSASNVDSALYAAYYTGESPGNINGLNESETRSYLGTLGKKESGNNYGIVNTLGFLGKYQFGYAALRDIGYVNSNANSNSDLNNPSVWTGKNSAISKEAFLRQPETQEAAIVLYTNKNYSYLVPTIPLSRLPSDEIGGWLMCAHLGGHNNAKKLYTDNIPFVDAYGTSNRLYYNLGVSAVRFASTSQNIETYGSTRLNGVQMVDIRNSLAFTLANSVANNPANPDGHYLTSQFTGVLETIVRHWGRPVQINSAYRSPAYNAQIGGASNSAHMRGIAADIMLSSIGQDSSDYNDFIKIASHYGIGGIGLYNTFIHLDIGSRRTWNQDGGRPSWVNDSVISAHSSNRYQNFQTVADISFNGQRFITYANSVDRVTDSNEIGIT